MSFNKATRLDSLPSNIVLPPLRAPLPMQCTYFRHLLVRPVMI